MVFKKKEKPSEEKIDVLDILMEDTETINNETDFDAYSELQYGEPNNEKPVMVENPPSIPAVQQDLTATTASIPELQHEDMFGRPMESDNQVKSVAKELFNQGQIELKTEVSHDEINNLTRLRFMRERFGIDNVETLTNSFLSLRVSKDRKSRSEFIAALQTENRNTNGGGIWSRLFGVNNNNNQ